MFLAFSILLVTFSQEKNQTIQDNQKKIFSFGVVADIQYADAEKAGNRDYRSSIQKLDTCINIFNKNDLSFVVTMGDMIDRDYISYDKPLHILETSKAPVYNVLGNHDFSVNDQLKSKIRKLLGNKKGYHIFRKNKFVFIILDGTDVSTFANIKGSRKYKIAMDELEEMKKNGLNNAYEWNSAMGSKQLKWLDKQLKKADREDEKVVIFCHWPLLPENGTQLWNNRDALKLLNSHKSVVAWIAGHHHEGSYVQSGNIHYLTLKGLVEAKSETSCGIIEVYPDKLKLEGYGDQKDQLLKFTR